MHHWPIRVIILAWRFYRSDLDLQDNKPRSLSNVKRRPRRVRRYQAIHGEIVVEEVAVVQEAHNLSTYSQYNFTLLIKILEHRTS
jgi:hypothetical protein